MNDNEEAEVTVISLTLIHTVTGLIPLQLFFFCDYDYNLGILTVILENCGFSLWDDNFD